jgi:hypothetical protein
MASCKLTWQKAGVEDEDVALDKEMLSFAKCGLITRPQAEAIAKKDYSHQFLQILELEWFITRLKL